MNERSDRVWLLLLAAVLLPAAGMSWFLLRGIASEREASEYRLAAAGREHLQAQRAKLESYWRQVAANAEATLRQGTAAGQFARLLAVADSVVIYDDSGSLAYPQPPRPLPLTPTLSTAEWERARRLEQAGDVASAAAHYAALAARSRHRHHVARALLGESRCRAKDGQTERALARIRGELLTPQFADACDADGHLITPAAQLLALQLIDDPTAPAHRSLLRDLAQRLRRYDAPMPSSQRSSCSTS
jgi:hypothetical protein